MSTRPILDRVATRAQVPRTTARAVLAALADQALETLSSGEPVTLPGLGVLEPRWVEERALRSVQDGRKLAIDGHYRAGFRPSTRLRGALRERTPQVLKDPAHQTAWRLAETLVADLDLYHGASAPREIPGRLSLEDVDARCAACFGSAWGRARRTYEEHTPASVREARDHLALAARKRWASGV